MAIENEKGKSRTLRSGMLSIKMAAHRTIWLLDLAALLVINQKPISLSEYFLRLTTNRHFRKS